MRHFGATVYYCLAYLFILASVFESGLAVGSLKVH
jgi:hypothetical protein